MGFGAVTGTYSWVEACEAGFDKVEPVSPWKKWTNRMMQFKARNFAMRDLFADYLKGIRTVEENSDAIDLQPSVGNDGREHYQLKAPAETELSGSGSIDENAFDILAAEQYPEGQEKLVEFVVLTAKANSASVDDLKNRAVGNWSEFIKAFEAWVSKQSNRNKPAEKALSPEQLITTQENNNGWNEFRAQFIKLQTAGFSTFVYKHKDRFRDLPPEIQKEAVDKWQKLYPDTQWPVDFEAETRINGQGTSRPVSYTKEYKELMTLKEQFPKIYADAKEELNIAPDTVNNCINLTSLISRKVDQEAANMDETESQQLYEPPPVTDTSGF
jgi:hypothetical protein